VFEYANRVHLADAAPIEPFLQIKRVKLSFPADSQLQGNDRLIVSASAAVQSCRSVPYLTCIIGGRGSGKSTLLNLMHEKLDSGSTSFFRDNRLTPATASVAENVAVEGIAEERLVEFLQQNEIEQFAADHKRLTSAILVRLRKLDTGGLLQTAEDAIKAATASTNAQIKRITDHYALSVQLSNAEKELKTQQGLVESNCK
jgi:ATPase subunit of ABC transporter with duplicated ATPase domains